MMLSIQNISLIRNGNEILHNISLEVNEGGIHVILGPNGAGKSTLAYVLMGIEGFTPSSGRILFNGEDITNKSIFERAKRGITLGWQEPARFEGLSIEEYLSLGMREKDEREIKKALTMVNLNPERYLKRKVDEALSGGERKRVEFAAIITMKPKLAILDEPDSGIDFVSLDDLLGVMKSLKYQNITLLIITHREEVARIGDRASLMCDGFIVKDSEPWEVTKYFRKVCATCPTRKYSIEGIERSR